MIYFARIELATVKTSIRAHRTFSMIKIGHSKNIPSRLKTLRAHLELPVILLATMPGGPEKEKALHKRFSRFRVGQLGGRETIEWFFPVRELWEFIFRIPD